MPILRGGETHSVDSKGRVKIPSRMLKSLTNEDIEMFIFTRGLDKCINAYPLNYWKQIEKKIENTNEFNSKDRYFLRYFMMWTDEGLLDGQQRIILPKKFMELAGIKNEVSILGVKDHLEFWDPLRLEKYLQSQEEEYERISEEVMTKQ